MRVNCLPLRFLRDQRPCCVCQCIVVLVRLYELIPAGFGRRTLFPAFKIAILLQGNSKRENQ